MAKRSYNSPVFLDGNGTISLTVSQLAALGVSDPAAWEEYWEEFSDMCLFEDFDVNNPDTWPEGFNLADSDTWDILIGF
ncbi:MAG: hypothetical protein IKF22_12605 [Lachnospiraceae bacterium]|nr:hypothetical protein [Lachnospiraceae bacterium]